MYSIWQSRSRDKMKENCCILWIYLELSYNDVIMSTMASQITSVTIVYSIVYSGADQRKHQSSASLAFVREIHRWPVNSPHKELVTRKMFPFDDVIMYQEYNKCSLLSNPEVCCMHAILFALLKRTIPWHLQLNTKWKLFTHHWREPSNSQHPCYRKYMFDNSLIVTGWRHMRAICDIVMAQHGLR